MLELILLLISLLGYGEISDFEDLTEEELQARIIAAQQAHSDEGRNGYDWDHPHHPNDDDNGGDGSGNSGND